MFEQIVLVCMVQTCRDVVRPIARRIIFLFNLNLLLDKSLPVFFVDFSLTIVFNLGNGISHTVM